MSLVPYKLTALSRLDTSGLNIIPYASVSVFNRGTGTYSTLKTGSTGATPLSNPFTCDVNGEKEFWASGGNYSISVAGGQSWDISLNGDTDITKIDTWADIATTPVSTAGQLFTLAQHTSDGVNGGLFMSYVGSVVDDGITQKNALGGFYLKKINISPSTVGTNTKSVEDYAIIGAELLPAITGYTHTNFDASRVHTAGTVGVLSSVITSIHSMSYMMLELDITTTANGYIDILVGSDHLMDDSPLGYYFSTTAIYTDGIENNRILTTNKYYFMLATNAAASAISLTTDTSWAGTITNISLKHIDPVKMFVSGQASDDTNADNPVGLKLTGFNRNDMALGDKFTLGAFQYDGVSPTPAHNFAAGARTLASNQRGDENTGIGSFALQYNEGSNNFAAGYSALKRNTKGQENTAAGYKAGVSNTTGSRNTFFGFWAGGLTLTGSDLTLVGWYAGRNNASDGLDTFVGAQSGLKQLSGTNNTYLGAYAGYGSSNGAGDSNDDNQVSVGGQSWAYGDNSYTIGAFSRVGTLAIPTTNSGAIGTNASVIISNATKIGNAQTSTTLSGRLASQITFASLGDVAGITYTPSQFFSEFLVRFSTAAPFTDTTPTAAAIIALIGGAEDLTGYDLYIKNVSSHTLTLAAGTGVTLDGVITVPSNKVRLIKVRIASVASNLVDVYSIALMDV